MKTIQPQIRIRAGLGLILLLAFVQFALLPLLDWQEQSRNEIFALQKEMAAQKGLIAQEAALANLRTEAETAFSDVAALYFQNIEDPEALQLRLQKDLEKLAKKSRLTVTSMDWLPPTVEDVIRAPLKIRYKGAPKQLLEFLAAVEAQKQFLSVDHLEARTVQRKALIQGTITVSAYGLKTKS